MCIRDRLAIYSSTVVSIDYFGDDNSKLPEPRHEMRMFHEPSPEIRKNEIDEALISMDFLE